MADVNLLCTVLIFSIIGGTMAEEMTKAGN